MISLFSGVKALSFEPQMLQNRLYSGLPDCVSWSTYTVIFGKSGEAGSSLCGLRSVYC